MMVIEKHIGENIKRLKVTSSAYNTFYKSAGWLPVGKIVDEASEEVANVSDDIDEASDEEWEDAMEDEGEPTKPLSEMNRNELEEMADKLGVSLAGLSTNKQIREAIKSVM